MPLSKKLMYDYILFHYSQIQHACARSTGIWVKNSQSSPLRVIMTDNICNDRVISYVDDSWKPLNDLRWLLYCENLILYNPDSKQVGKLC